MVRQKPRIYTMSRRAETAAETRARLIEATAALHFEQGVSSTSLRDIAGRAGVSVGTAYHHFPSYDEAVRACGHYTMQLYPPPDASIFENTRGTAGRVAAFVLAMGSYEQSCPWIEGIRAERSRYLPIAEGIGALERNMARLARLALEGVPSKELPLSMLLAFTDVAVFRTLRERGLSLHQACSSITGAVLASLPPSARRRDGRAGKPSRRRSS